MTLVVRAHAVRRYSTRHATAEDWRAGTDREPVLPTYSLLVGRAGRFTSLVTQLHIEVCGALHALCDEPPAGVFATCHGEIRTAEALMADMRANAPVSSARFAQSVHNTASGAYAVATSNGEPMTTLTGANAYAAGWLEAVTLANDGHQVLLSLADEPVPMTFEGPPGDEGVATAYLLGPGAVRLPRAELDRVLELALVPSGPPAGSLADACHAVSTGSGTVRLGEIAPGQHLELRVQP